MKKTILLVAVLSLLFGIIHVNAISKNIKKVVRLQFTEADFFDENGDFKYEADEEKLPWKDHMAMLKSLEEVRHLVYEHSTLVEGTNEFKTKILTADVYSDLENYTLSIDFIFYGYDKYNLPEDADLPPNKEFTNPLYPLEDNLFRVLDKEQIITASGTFDCTIVEIIWHSDVCLKAWMIDDKPGVYARIIEDKPGMFGHYYIYELNEIK